MTAYIPTCDWKKYECMSACMQGSIELEFLGLLHILLLLVSLVFLISQSLSTWLPAAFLQMCTIKSCTWF